MYPTPHQMHQAQKFQTGHAQPLNGGIRKTSEELSIEKLSKEVETLKAELQVLREDLEKLRRQSRS